MARWLGLLVVALWLHPAAARDVHVAAQGAAAVAAPDGTAARPWPTLADALGPGGVTGGDRVVLAPGRHGTLTVRGRRYDRPVAIGPAKGQVAHAERIAVEDSRHVLFHDLQVWPPAPGGSGRPLVQAGAGAEDIGFTALDIRAVADAPDHMGWSLEQWRAARINGVDLRGPRNALRDSRVTATEFGVQASGPDAVVQGNLIDGFSGDGLRGLGDGSVFRGNTVRNCFVISNNHYDGFQSWSRGPKPGQGVVRGIVIDGNSFLEWTGAPGHPLRCQLQGIGLFDGMFADFVIQNNVIAVTAYHGIAVYGGIGTRILNNTVVRSDGDRGKFPWIKVAPHKDGRPSQGTVVANNLAMAYDIKPAPARHARNLTMRSGLKELEAPQRGDFRPRRGGEALDGGDPALAPPTDRLGAARPVGAAPDLGAIERP